MRVLLTIQDKESCLFLKDLFEKYGCRVDIAPSAETAIKKAESVLYDIVVLADKIVGRHTDAYDVAEAVRKSRFCNKAEIILVYSGRTTGARIKSVLRKRIRLSLHNNEVKTFPFSSIFKGTERARALNATKEKGNIPRSEG